MHIIVESGGTKSPSQEAEETGSAQSQPEETEETGSAQSQRQETGETSSAQSQPQETGETGSAQSRQQETEETGKAQSHPQETKETGIAQSQPQETKETGKAQSQPQETKETGSAHKRHTRSAYQKAGKGSHNTYYDSSNESEEESYDDTDNDKTYVICSDQQTSESDSDSIYPNKVQQKKRPKKQNKRQVKRKVKPQTELVAASFSDDSEAETAPAVLYPALVKFVDDEPVEEEAQEDAPVLEEEMDLDEMNVSDEDSTDEISESDIVRDNNQKDIYFTKLKRSETSKKGKRKRCPRVYNAKHPCPFCKKMILRFSQHVLAVHKDKPQVKEILRLNLESEDTEETRKTKVKERKAKLDILRLKGSHEHNLMVLRKGKGEIILGRRRETDKFDVTNYGPCPGCLEWLRLSIIKRHQYCCPASTAPARKSKGELLVQSDVISGRIKSSASKLLTKEVLPIMREDKIGLEAKNDDLIIALGNNWMLRNVSNHVMRKYYTSCVMRLAARLKIALNKMATPVDGGGLDSYLAPTYFDHVTKAALVCSDQDDDDEEELGSPSNAIKLQYDIKRLCSIKLAKAIMNGDEKRKKEANEFLQLMEISWSSKLARVALQRKRMNRKKPLPLPEDIQKLASYLNGELDDFDPADTSYPNYRRGVMLVEAKLISYNRRRCGELQAML